MSEKKKCHHLCQSFHFTGRRKPRPIGKGTCPRAEQTIPTSHSSSHHLVLVLPFAPHPRLKFLLGKHFNDVVQRLCASWFLRDSRWSKNAHSWINRSQPPPNFLHFGRRAGSAQLFHLRIPDAPREAKMVPCSRLTRVMCWAYRCLPLQQLSLTPHRDPSNPSSEHCLREAMALADYVLILSMKLKLPEGRDQWLHLCPPAPATVYLAQS